MRLSPLGLIAILAACTSSGPRPQQQSIVRVTAAAALPHAAQPGAPAKPERPPSPIPAGAIRFVRVDPHHAAHFLAHMFRAKVIVVGGTGTPITLGLQAETAEGALRELAQASGLALEVEGKIFVMAPAESLVARSEQAALKGGRALSLSFHRIEASRLVEILAQVENITIEGSLVGTVSLLVRNVPSREVLRALVRLSGQEARVEGRTVTLSGPGGLPATPERTGENCPGEDSGYVALPCVPASELEVCATAMVGIRSEALVRRRGTGAGSGLIAAVLSQSRLGESSVNVASVDTDGVTLADGTRLPLGGR